MCAFGGFWGPLSALDRPKLLDPVLRNLNCFPPGSIPAVLSDSMLTIETSHRTLGASYALRNRGEGKVGFDQEFHDSRFL